MWKTCIDQSTHVVGVVVLVGVGVYLRVCVAVCLEVVCLIVGSCVGGRSGVLVGCTCVRVWYCTMRKQIHLADKSNMRHKNDVGP